MITRGWRQFAAGALCLAAFPAGAEEAALVTAADPARIAALLQQAGYPAEIVTTAYGDPAIISEAAGGVPFELRFYGCDRGVDCLSLQLLAGFAADGADMADANDWNRAMRYGRAHAGPDGAMFLAYDINLEAGGVPLANFMAQLAMWQMLLDRFIARLPD